MAEDHVDSIVAQWERERPDIDTTGMAIVGRIRRIDRVIQERIDAVFAGHGLEAWEFDVLATLRRNGEPHQLTPGELLDSMMITSGAMTNRIDRLQGRGLVERRPHPDDGRQVLVSLTAAGRELVDTVVADHAANQVGLVSSLTERQQQQLTELLRKLGQGLAS
jgi:DNA-binding MarR family transcriptional regulator